MSFVSSLEEKSCEKLLDREWAWKYFFFSSSPLKLLYWLDWDVKVAATTEKRFLIREKMNQTRSSLKTCRVNAKLRRQTESRVTWRNTEKKAEHDKSETPSSFYFKDKRLVKGKNIRSNLKKVSRFRVHSLGKRKRKKSMTSLLHAWHY